MKECSAWFNFTTEELIDAFNRRDKWQLIPVASDAELVLFARRTVLNGRPAYTLALASRADNRLNLQFAIRIPPVLYDEIDLLTPLEMLQLTVERYGLAVTVDGITAFLVLRHSFEAQVADDLGCLTQVHNPDNHAFLHLLLVKISPKPPGFAVDCAFVFALDQTRLQMDLA
jgi:hypothetical protein